MHIDAVISKQLLRFAAVGLASNLLLYLAYLLITQQGVGHKTTMTLLYAVGVSLTFFFNRNWTFSHQGHVTKSFIAYLSTYALGYVLNWVTLYLLVDKFGYNHQLVQGLMILFLAVLLFTLQKFFVFGKT